MTMHMRDAAPTPRGSVLAGLLVLSLGAGATDAFAFLQLGGIFSANMTGNLILIALPNRPHYPLVLSGAAAAIVAFIVGAVIAARLTRGPTPVRRWRLATVLAIEAVAQATVLLVWWVAEADIGVSERIALIASSSLAMGLQTVASRRVLASITTTYVTGTIVSLLTDLTDGKGLHRSVGALSVGALVAGALAGALSQAWSPLAGPVLPLLAALVGGSLVAGAAPPREPEQASHTAGVGVDERRDATRG